MTKFRLLPLPVLVLVVLASLLPLGPLARPASGASAIALVEDPKLRHIAVIGDSAAVGAGPTARVDAWPEQLGRLLGPEFATRAYVRAAGSVDAASPRFVRKAPEWKWMEDFAPEVVIVALGSSDAMTVGFPAASRLDAGMREIVDAIAAFPSKPRVIVCLPPPCAPSWSRASTYRANRVRVIDAWKRVAAAAKLTTIDLEPPLSGVEATLVDGIASNPVAGGRIARSVAEAVLGAPSTVRESTYRPGAMMPPLGRVRYIVDGVVRTFVVAAEQWKFDAGSLVGTSSQDPLAVTLHAGEGPFRWRMRIRIDGGVGSAAQIALDDQFVLFEDAAKNLTLIGELFRGKPIVGPSVDYWQRGEEFDLEVRRVQHDVEFLIDGKVFFVCPGAGWNFKTLALIPMTSTVRVRSWTIDEGSPSAEPPPTVDLAGRTDLQTIVDRRDGQYIGHPSTVLLADGTTILCAYPLGHGRGAIVLRKSEDGGVTWSEPLPTPANWATSLETPTLHRLADPTKGGAPRYVLFSGLHPTRIASSDDGGATWSELAPVGAWGGIVTMSSVIETRDGTAIAFFHDDGRFFRPNGRGTGVSTVYSTASRDGGRTWSEPRALLSKEREFLCEPGVVRSPDGKRLAMLLRENTRSRNSFIAFSDDNGEHWSEPRELPDWLTGDRHVIVRLKDGRYFVSMRDMSRTSPTYGDWVAWVGAWDDLERGDRGELRLRLMDNHDGTDCGYAGVETLPDGTVVATSYGHWIEGAEPYVVSLRIPLAAISERPVSPSASPDPTDENAEPATTDRPPSEPPPADAP